MRRVKPAQLAPACRPLDDAASLLRKLEAAFAGALIPTRTKLLCALVSARGEGTDSSGEASGVAREVSSCSWQRRGRGRLSVVSPLSCANLQYSNIINCLLRLLLFMVIVVGTSMGATLRTLLSVAGCAFMWLRVDRLQVDPSPGRSMPLPSCAAWWTACSVGAPSAPYALLRVQAADD